MGVLLKTMGVFVSDFDPKKAGPVAKFYDFANSDLPPIGVSFPEHKTEPAGPVTRETQAAAWDDIVSPHCAPDGSLIKCGIATNLFANFRDGVLGTYNKNHYIRIEKFPDGKDYYVIRFWKKWNGLEYIRLGEVDEKNPPKVVKMNKNDDGHIYFDIGNKKISGTRPVFAMRERVGEKIEERVGLIVEFEDREYNEDSGFKNGRHALVVPVNRQGGDRGLQVHDIRSSAKAYSPYNEYSKARDIEETHRFVWQVDIMPRSPAGDRPKNSNPVVAEKGDKTRDPVLPVRPSDKPEDESSVAKKRGKESDPAFVDRTIKEIEKQSGEKGLKDRDVNIIFAIDISVSMNSSLALVIMTVSDVVGRLQDKGVQSINIGLVLFDGAGQVFLKSKLASAASKKDLIKLIDLLSDINFPGDDNSFEYVAEAISVSLEELSDSTSVNMIKVLTDRSGVSKMGEEFVHGPVVRGNFYGLKTISSQLVKAEEMNVGVEIHDEYNTFFIPAKIAGEIEKYKITNNYDKLLSLALNSQDDRVRIESTRVLAGLGEKAKSELLELVLNSQDSEVRLESARVLAGLGEKAKAELLDLALKSQNDRARIESAKVLAELGEKEGLKILLALALESRDNWVCFESIRALASLGETAKFELLTLTLKSQSNQVRSESIKALEQLGERAKSEFLELALKSQYYEVRIESARVLASLGEKAKSELFALALKLQDGQVRIESAGALTQLGEKARFELLELALKSQDDWVRLESAKVLAGLGEKEGLKILLEIILKSQNDHVRSESREALAGLGYSLLRDINIGNGSPVVNSIVDMAVAFDKDDRLYFASMVAVIIDGLKISDDKETIAATEELFDTAESSGKDASFTLYSLANFAIYWSFGDVEILKKTFMPLINDVAKAVRDEDVRREVIGRLAGLVKNGRSIEEVTAYKKELLQNLDSINVTIAGVEYKLLHELHVNEGSLHYYVNTSRAEGELSLRSLAFKATLEEAWIHVKYVKDGVEHERWFEAGEMEEAGRVSSNSKLLQGLLSDNRVKISDIRHYHIHPMGGVDRGSGLVILLSSPEDVMSAVSLDAYIKSSGYNGPFESVAVTPVGTYRLVAGDISVTSTAEIESKASEAAEKYSAWLGERNGRLTFESDVVAGINATGLVTAVYEFHAEPMADVERLYGELSEITKKSNVMVQGQKEVTAEMYRPFWEKLSGHYPAFASAISASIAAGVPEDLLSHYIIELETEFKNLSALRPLFSRD